MELLLEIVVWIKNCVALTGKKERAPGGMRFLSNRRVWHKCVIPVFLVWPSCNRFISGFQDIIHPITYTRRMLQCETKYTVLSCQNLTPTLMSQAELWKLQMTGFKCPSLSTTCIILCDENRGLEINALIYSL